MTLVLMGEQRRWLHWMRLLAELTATDTDTV